MDQDRLVIACFSPPPSMGETAKFSIFDIPNVRKSGKKNSDDKSDEETDNSNVVAIVDQVVRSADSAEITWSPSGQAITIMANTIVDTAGENYGGIGDVWFARLDGSLVTQINKKVAQDVQWSPVRDEFILIEGKSPSDFYLYDKYCQQKFAFPRAYRNTIRWCPFGLMVAFGGFGNLAGELSFWYRDAETHSMKLITECKEPCTVLCDWAPDGVHFMIASIYPRMKVDNVLKILTYEGECVSKKTFNELYDVCWKPELEGTFSIPPRPQPKIIQQTKQTYKPKNSNSLLFKSNKSDLDDSKLSETMRRKKEEKRRKEKREDKNSERAAKKKSIDLDVDWRSAHRNKKNDELKPTDKKVPSKDIYKDVSRSLQNDYNSCYSKSNSSEHSSGTEKNLNLTNGQKELNESSLAYSGLVETTTGSSSSAFIPFLDSNLTNSRNQYSTSDNVSTFLSLSNSTPSSPSNNMSFNSSPSTIKDEACNGKKKAKPEKVKPAKGAVQNGIHTVSSDTPRRSNQDINNIFTHNCTNNDGFSSNQGHVLSGHFPHQHFGLDNVNNKFQHSKPNEVECSDNNSVKAKQDKNPASLDQNNNNSLCSSLLSKYMSSPENNALKSNVSNSFISSTSLSSRCSSLYGLTSNSTIPVISSAQNTYALQQPFPPKGDDISNYPKDSTWDSAVFQSLQNIRGSMKQSTGSMNLNLNANQSTNFQNNKSKPPVFNQESLSSVASNRSSCGVSSPNFFQSSQNDVALANLLMQILPQSSRVNLPMAKKASASAAASSIPGNISSSNISTANNPPPPPRTNSGEGRCYMPQDILVALVKTAHQQQQLHQLQQQLQQASGQQQSSASALLAAAARNVIEKRQQQQRPTGLNLQKPIGSPQNNTRPLNASDSVILSALKMYRQGNSTQSNIGSHQVTATNSIISSPERPAQTPHSSIESFSSGNSFGLNSTNMVLNNMSAASKRDVQQQAQKILNSLQRQQQIISAQQGATPQTTNCRKSNPSQARGSTPSYPSQAATNIAAIQQLKNHNNLPRTSYTSGASAQPNLFNGTNEKNPTANLLEWAMNNTMGHDQPPPPPPQQQQQVQAVQCNQNSTLNTQYKRPDAMKEKCWQYVDPKGNIQGPFFVDEMRAWNTMGYFDPSLPVRCFEHDRFVPLNKLFPNTNSTFLSPPKPQPIN